MIRGTTPIISFVLPFDPAECERLWFTVSQRGVELFNKELPDMAIDGQKISVKLTQNDTLRLNASQKVEIQVRIRTKGGDALASQIVKTEATEILRNGVI